MTANTSCQQLAGDLRERVAESAQRLNVPGVAVGITSDGDVDVFCHGITSITNPLPVHEGTFFQIGSTGKTYTATAIMVLAEAGLVELSSPVRRYLPDFHLKDEEVAERVTLLHLLNHTAGWDGDFFIDTGYGDDALEQFVGRMAEVNQDSPLGARFSYNNAALSVAGRIIEKVTGKTYEAAIRKLVLEPIGLSEHFYFPWEVITRRVAVGHHLVDGELKTTEWYLPRSMHPQGGALASTVRDQVRYARFHLGDVPGPLGRDRLQQMRIPTVTAAAGGAIEGIGIIWQLRNVDGVQVVSHGGTTHGHESAFEMVPERNFAITVLTNALHGAELNREIVRWAFDAYLGVTEAEPEPISLSAESLSEYAGIYQAPLGTFEVTVDDDRLVGVMTFSPEAIAEILPPGEEMPPWRVPFKILPSGAYLVVEGEHKGEQGPIVRGPTGRIEGIELGGRILTKRS